MAQHITGKNEELSCILFIYEQTNPDKSANAVPSQYYPLQWQKNREGGWNKRKIKTEIIKTKQARCGLVK